MSRIKRNEWLFSVCWLMFSIIWIAMAVVTFHTEANILAGSNACLIWILLFNTIYQNRFEQITKTIITAKKRRERLGEHKMETAYLAELIGQKIKVTDLFGRTYRGTLLSAEGGALKLERQDGKKGYLEFIPIENIGAISTVY